MFEVAEGDGDDDDDRTTAYDDETMPASDADLYDERYSSRAVNDMLKDSYIYAKSGCLLEKMREDLHIDRLKNEMKHALL